ncbi:hypothetical protein [Dolichospermum sp. UHCC 0259]|uniref:hypothetical protein n=1 Tax=Dolichospermum sp. UHCC 0259 TaxID=2590010 RepID=UPI00144586CB|nr:hypothetical protein [Dolichospermum sp. UHCC 0259]
MNLPDPSWDYSELYQHCQLAKEALDRAIATMSSAEQANDTTDDVLIESLEAVQGEALNALDCIPKWQKYRK